MEILPQVGGASRPWNFLLKFARTARSPHWVNWLVLFEIHFMQGPRGWEKHRRYDQSRAQPTGGLNNSAPDWGNKTVPIWALWGCCTPSLAIALRMWSLMHFYLSEETSPGHFGTIDEEEQLVQMAVQRSLVEYGGAEHLTQRQYSLVSSYPPSRWLKCGYFYPSVSYLHIVLCHSSIY